MQKIGFLRGRFSLSDAVMVLVILCYVLVQANFLSHFRMLPSYVYGGDLYHQLGSVYHISQSGPGGWFSSSTFSEGLPHYLPVYGIYVSLFVWLLALSPMKALYVSSVVLSVLVLGAAYLIFRRIFGSGFIAVLGATLFLTLDALPLMKYTLFAQYLMTPLLAYCLYRFYFEEANAGNALRLGFLCGIFSLSHPLGFVASVFFIGFFTLFHALKHMKERPVVYRMLKHTAAAVVVWFLISQLYWFKPIFIYHGKTVNGIQDWAFYDFGNKAYQMIFLENSLQKIFADASGVYGVASSVLVITGLIAAFSVRRNRKAAEFARWFFIASVVLTYSYFITEPLFGTNFTPDYALTFMLRFSVISLQLFALTCLWDKRDRKILLFAAVFTLIVANGVSGYNRMIDSELFKQAQKNPTTYFLPLQKAVLENTNASDVFLSNNELSFVLNAFTGRKLLTNRRAHSGTFTDADSQELDGAIILYGNNTLRKLELIKKHDIKYLFWNELWVDLEYKDYNLTQTLDTQGNVKVVDPMVVTDKSEYQSELKENNIRYFTSKTWLDPSIEGEYVEKLDLIFISPENYRSRERPWRSDLDPYLTEYWSYTEFGRRTTRVYKFDQTKMDEDLKSA